MVSQARDEELEELRRQAETNGRMLERATIENGERAAENTRLREALQECKRVLLFHGMRRNGDLYKQIAQALTPKPKCPVCEEPWDMENHNACSCGATLRKTKCETCGDTGFVDNGAPSTRWQDKCPDCEGKLHD